jgi:hypothetical protein
MDSWYVNPTAGHERHGQSVLYDETTGRSIAIIYDGKSHGDLLVSAPDLLEALTDLVTHYDWGRLTYDESQHETVAPAIRAARAAIAKATGKEFD